MKLQELMTRDVITIGPDAPLKEAARRMIEARVSGLPVTDGSGSLVGVITEADFVKKESHRRAKERPRLLSWLDRGEHDVLQQVVADVMTRDVITLPPDADHPEAARLMEESSIKRVPVVSGDGQLVGLVSRSDILRVFARADSVIITEIETRVMRGVLWIDPKLVNVTCEDGNVVFTGELETKSDASLLIELTSRLDGVVSVQDHLRWRVDNTKVQMAPPPLGTRW